MPKEYREQLVKADAKDPSQQTPQDRNLIRPVDSPMQKTMDSVAARIQANFASKVKDKDYDPGFKRADEARRQRSGTTATPREMAALDQQLRRLAARQGRNAAQPTLESRPANTIIDRARERQQGIQQMRETLPRPKLTLRSNDRGREHGD